MGNSEGKKAIDIEVNSQTQRVKLVTGLMLPSLGEGILTSVVSMFDMMMVSVIGEEAINAVGLVTQPRFVMLAAFMALGVGATALTARFKGANEQHNAIRVFNQSIVLTLFLTVVLCVTMFIFRDPLVRLIAGDNLSENSIVGALTYLRIQIIGFPTLSLTFSISAALRGVGNTRASFYANSISNVVNIFFNYCMIGGNLGFPKLGIAGASIATVIGQCCGLAFVLYTVLGGKSYIKLQVKQLLRIDFPLIKRILRIGIPALIEQVVMRVGVILFTMIVTSLGDNAYTAHMVVVNIQQIAFTTGMSFGTAATTLVGQCLGRLRIDLAKVYVKITQNVALLVSIAMSLFLFFGGSLVARLYTDSADIIKLASQALKIVALANPVSNARFVYLAALRGAGDSKFAAIFTGIGALIIRPSVALLLVSEALPFHLGLIGIWIAFVVDFGVCFIMALYRYRAGKWALLKV